MNGLAVKKDPPSARDVKLPTGIDREKLEGRFWAKVDKNGPLWAGTACWVWTAARSEGYGRFVVEGHVLKASRVAYELLIAPISVGLTLDHLCRNTGCVNPAHMEAVTTGVNVLRGNTITATNAVKTHCRQGHPYDLWNTYTRKSGAQKGNRICRQCSHVRYQRGRK